MYIKKIKLKNFRNLEDINIDLDKDINVFYGDNAQGKTNIIEAIYLLSIGKSFRTNVDNEFINFSKDFSVIEIEFFDYREKKIILRIERDKKKKFELNGILQKKLSDIFGILKIIIFKPEDIELVNGGPSKRRKFLDLHICFLNKKYIELISSYSKVLEEKNSCLKKIKKQQIRNFKILDTYDEILAKLNYEIYNIRKKNIDELNKKIKEIHSNISCYSNNNEEINLEYVSNINEKDEIFQKLLDNRSKDILRGFSSIGIHRDDIKITINGMDITLYGSQGQKKSSILSLKLSELFIFNEHFEDEPILLLDDFMSELDKDRKRNFIKNIKNSQIIITSTEKIDFEGRNEKFFNIKKGKIN